MSLLRTRLPPLYHDLLPDLFDEAYPEERFATCDTCFNCRSDASPYLSTKCCTYYPSLPNFLVGGILRNVDEDVGRERIRAIIGARIGVTPYGLLRPVSRRLQPPTGTRQQPTRAEAEATLCPYYNDGRCGIWTHREHLCSTYFCHSTGGQSGTAFWQALNQYLRLVERELSLHALLTMGWPIDQLRVVNPLADWTPSSTPAVERQRRNAWRNWAGREVEFYLECHRVAAATNRTTVESLLGWKGRQLEARLRELLAGFRASVIPETLQVAPGLQVIPENAEEVRVTVSHTQSVRLPRVAALFLKQFDGVRGTTEVIQVAASLRVDLTRHIAELRAAGILLDG